MPESSVTADAIVAFPGESRNEFEETLSIIKEIKFDLVNTAAYSPRPNTPAALWPNQLSEKIKIDRLREINNLVEKTAKERNARYMNNIEEVLVEGINPKNNLQLMEKLYILSNLNELIPILKILFFNTIIPALAL